MTAIAHRLEHARYTQADDRRDGQLGRAIRAEWTKLRSVRSTSWSLIALVGGTLALSAISCASASTQGGSPSAPGDDDIVLFSLAGAYLGQIAVVALASLAITSEYATGTIHPTLAAMPRRSLVLAAKVAVVGTITLVVGLATTLASFAMGQWILHGNGYVYENGYPAATLADGPTLRAVVGAALYLSVLALLCLGVGAVVRHTAGAICAVLALLFVPQMMIGLLPDRTADFVQTVAPMSAGLGLLGTEGTGTPIGPWAGLGVAAAWAAALLAAGFWMLARRDA
jgi:ABC-2 type transport system permease protein